MILNLRSDIVNIEISQYFLNKLLIVSFQTRTNVKSGVFAISFARIPSAATNAFAFRDMTEKKTPALLIR
jgi:hypothetical protein